MPIIHDYSKIDVQYPELGRDKLGLATVEGPPGPPGPMGATGPAGPEGSFSLSFSAPLVRTGDTVSLDLTESIAWSGSVGWFGSPPAVQQASGANLTNNVTAGGTDNTIANYTDLTTYANDAAAIRNDIYQLARKLKQVNDALRLYGLLT